MLLRNIEASYSAHSEDEQQRGSDSHAQPFAHQCARRRGGGIVCRELFRGSRILDRTPLYSDHHHIIRAMLNLDRTS